jgi:class 3 adenylate cyclase/predicted ATPase
MRSRELAAAESVTFGDFRLDLRRRELYRAGAPVPLKGRPLEILCELAAANGELVTKDDLMARLWPGQVVEENNIQVHVSALRKTLRNSEGGDSYSYVVTDPGRGYRLLGLTSAPAAPTGELQPAAAPATPAAPAALPPALTVVSEPAPSPRPVERRQITIVSCEFAGLAALAAELDPEDLRAEIAGCHNRCAEVFAGFSGVVAKFTGDGLTAYFGYPTAHEHDAERAVRAALAAAETIGDRDTAESARIALRIGIATGLVLVGDLSGAGADYAAVGETPQLAAALRSRASAGAVVIAPATRRLVGTLFEYRPLGPVAIETSPEPVEAFQVVADRASESRFRALHETGTTAFVGRDDEIGQLARAWRHTKSGDGRVALISGEAGVGKSRLCAALAEHIAAEPHALISWQCSPHHPDSALHPALVQLEAAAGFARGETQPERRRKLDKLLEQCTDEEATLLAAALGLAEAPPHLTPQRRKQKTLEALIGYFARLAARTPLLALIEDTHWIDPTSLELLTLLAERVQSLPIMLLVTARPEFVPPWPAESHVTAITLSRLGRRDAEALIAGIANKPLPDQVLEEILKRTDRVPLFVEEMTKAIIEGGHVIDTGARYELSGPLPLNTIPVTLQDSLTARLDRLEHGREVAQTGAAIGREFSQAVLSAALEPDGPDLSQALDELVRAELAFRRGVPPNAVYTFKHALVRDAAYNSMLRTRRRACHGRIATAIQRYEPDIVAAQPELLAYHYQEADDARTALPFWIKAGDLAERRAAGREATAHYRAALALLPGVSDDEARLQAEFDLHLRLANVLMQVEGFISTDAQAAAARACEIAREAGWTERYVGAACDYATALLARGQCADALKLFAVVNVKDLDRLGPTTRTRAGAMDGICNFYLGRFEESWRSLERAIRLDDAEPCTAAHPILACDPAIVLRAFGARVRAFQGYLDTASRLADEAIMIAELRNHAFSLTRAHMTAAHVLLLCGRYAEAEASATQMITLAERHGFEAIGAYGLSWRGIARVALGRVAEGLGEMRDGRARWNQIGGKAGGSSYACLAAEWLIQSGQVDAAEEFLETGEQELRETDEELCQAEFIRLRGALLLQQGKTQEAQAKLREAMSVADAQGARLLALRATTDLAPLLAAGGQRDKAYALLRRLYQEFTEGLQTPALQRAAAALAMLEGD